MNYRFTFFLLLPIVLLGSKDDFPVSVEKFKYYAERKNVFGMQKAAKELLPKLQEYAKDNCKGFDKRLHGPIVEGLYTFVQSLRRKHVSPFKDFLTFSRTKELLNVREEIVEMISPALEILCKAGAEFAAGRVAKDGSPVKKDESVDDDLPKARLIAAKFQTHMYLFQDSKLSLGPSGGAVTGFEHAQSFVLQTFSKTLNEAEAFSSLWCSAATGLVDLLFAIESTNTKAPFYHELKSVCDVKVEPYISQKGVMVPTSLLIAYAKYASRLNRSTYYPKSSLICTIDRLNEKLFMINETAVDKGVDGIDSKMKRFVLQAARLNNLFSVSKMNVRVGFTKQEVACLQKSLRQFHSNLDEIFKLLKINEKK